MDLLKLEYSLGVRLDSDGFDRTAVDGGTGPTGDLARSQLPCHMLNPPSSRSFFSDHSSAKVTVILPCVAVTSSKDPWPAATYYAMLFRPMPTEPCVVQTVSVPTESRGIPRTTARYVLRSETLLGEVVLS